MSFWTPTDVERGPNGEHVVLWQNRTIDVELSKHERELARQSRLRFKRGELTPAELAVEIDRWEQDVALLSGDLAAGDFLGSDEATLRAGIAYAEAQLADLERQAGRFLRANVPDGAPVTADFDAARYVDLVDLAETLLAAPARRAGGRHLIRCPFHDDERPSLVIYPPGQGWWCPVCRKGGQDAASFCAEFFACTQLEGLRWVQQLCGGAV